MLFQIGNFDQLNELASKCFRLEFDPDNDDFIPVSSASGGRSGRERHRVEHGSNKTPFA